MFRKFKLTKTKNVFYIFCNIFFAKITVVKIIPCLIIFGVMFLMQFMAEVKVCDATVIDNLVVCSERNIVSLEVNESMIKYIPNYFSGGIEFVSSVDSISPNMPTGKSNDCCKCWISEYTDKEINHKIWDALLPYIAIVACCFFVSLYDKWRYR